MAMKAFLKSFKYVPKSERKADKPTTFYMVTLSRSEIIQFISALTESMQVDISDLQEKDLDKVLPKLTTQENIKSMLEMYSGMILKSVKKIDNFYIGDKFYESTISPEIIERFINYLPSLELIFELGNQIFKINMPSEDEVKN